MKSRVSGRLFLLFSLICLPLAGYATHQKAAELTVRHVSGYTYRAILTTYTFTGTPVDRPEIELAWGDGTVEVVSRSGEQYLGNDTKMNRYEAVHTYSGPGVYTLYMEDPNRNSGVINVPNSVLTYMYISTSIIISPWLGAGNSTPVTTHRPVDDNACLGKRYTHNPGAYDPDADSLSYRLVPCRTMNGEDVPGYSYPVASDTFFIYPTTGTLVWQSPMAQGEYNVAILMEEWRNGIKLGHVTRDMQILVRTCSNNPPYIEAEEEHCVLAGTDLHLPVSVRDQDGDRLRLTAFGEILSGGRRSGLNELYNGIDSAEYDFYWVTGLADSRRQPYMLYLRAQDNGDPNLSDVRTVSVRVVAPPVSFVRSEAGRDRVELAWNKSLSPHASGYELYRRDFYRDETPADTCFTGISDSSYILVGSFAATDTSFTDFSVQKGMEYCYKVVVTFPDGDRSRESEPVCVETPNFSPLITQVSVLETDVFEGCLQVSWVRPKDLDSGSQRYRLYGGQVPDSLEFLADFAFDSCVRYVDSGRNTERIRYFYRVEVDSFASRRASSVYLTAIGKPRRVELQWVCDVPWIVERYDVYRYNDSAQAFGLIGSTKDRMYSDRHLEPGTEYTYYVDAIATYGSRRLNGYTHNLSNIIGETARPGEPCQPYVFVVQSNCDPFYNKIVWSFDSAYDPFAPERNDMQDEYLEDCRLSTDYYEIYRREPDQGDWDLIATVPETEYTDNEPGSLFSCYRVVGVADAGLYSEPSGEACTDNWNCFVFDLPNVFTPNGDGVNDVLKPRKYRDISEFYIKIVNRWGVEVFKSSKPDFEWNGQMYNKGKECPDGAYFYMAEFKARASGRTFKKVQSGSVTILR
ncbi:MAG: gliding motility-associated C-terminal domain-containing protein [Bacteroides sp.]|nr:gliding motility-associated C-terminal domain-containing protein [Bacteroides sp.]MCM1085842.1 gliding motility-associated C-terminal domain-containing protein [Bacteroides sp.]